MSEKRARYGRSAASAAVGRLRLLTAPGGDDDAGSEQPDEQPDEQGVAPVAADSPLATAIMHAVVGWVALCVERVAVAVDIQPIAERLYEVSVHYDLEQTEGIILRARLEVDPGLVMRMTVEPVRPS